MDTHGHLVNHIQHSCLTNDNTLHVVLPITNPMRWHSRYRLFRQCYAELMATANVKVYVVEVAYGDRQFECTEAGNPQHLQLRSKQEIWVKEGMINLAVKRLFPLHWKYMAWLDADISFADPHWAQEALHQLQFFNVIQPWRDCLDLGFHGTVLQHFQSFCYIHRLGVPKQKHPTQPYKYAHTGYAWCCTKVFWEMVGGLMDFAILGSADHHQGFGMVGDVKDTVHKDVHPNFKRLCNEWSERAYRACQGRLGFVPTRISHAFHGPKAKRKYRERWAIPIKHNYDPVTDLTYDEQGLPHLIGKPALLQDCHEYHVARNEDNLEDW